jgi:hypothetical protein
MNSKAQLASSEGFVVLILGTSKDLMLSKNLKQHRKEKNTGGCGYEHFDRVL